MKIADYLRAMQLYYLENVEGDRGHLSPEESRHLRDVVRAREGADIRCTDGLGVEYLGKIERLAKKGGSVLIEEKIAHARPIDVHLAIAPTKNITRTEWALEKCTEIGISQITPIIGQHSERKHLRMDRLRKIMLSAAKQSRKFHFPMLHEPQKCLAFLKSQHSQASKYMAYCGAEKLPLLNRIYAPHKSVLIMVGPEGDFSPVEAELAKDLGFELVSLGANRLRTETAAIVASTIIQQKIFSA